LETPHFEVQRLRDDDENALRSTQSHLIESENIEEPTLELPAPAAPVQEAAVKRIQRQANPVPTVTETIDTKAATTQAKPGLLQWLVSKLFGSPADTRPEETA